MQLIAQLKQAAAAMHQCCVNGWMCKLMSYYQLLVAPCLMDVWVAYTW